MKRKLRKRGSYEQSHPKSSVIPAERTTPGFVGWLRESKIAAVAWLAVRVWVGIMWIQAGVAKVWGAENPAFLHNNGAGVAGFAGHGAAAYSWWGSFLHSFVVPNASWIAVIVAFGEFAIGLGLAFGFLTRIAAIASLALLFTYIMSGTASVCGVLRTVRDHRARHVAHVDVDRCRRTHRWLQAASSQPRRAPVDAAPAAEPTPELVSVA